MVLGIHHVCPPSLHTGCQLRWASQAEGVAPAALPGANVSHHASDANFEDARASADTVAEGGVVEIVGDSCRVLVMHAA